MKITKNEIESLVGNLVNRNQVFDSPQTIQLTNFNDENNTRWMNLKIELDSWSPVYNSGELRFREKIATNCFDYDTNIEEQELYSYVDHKISIENMIASTNDKSMVVKKENNTIYAQIRVNENDFLSKKTADLIESGAIKSNSFIFKPLDVSYNYYDEENREVDFEIIFTKGELISIDPVYKGFYSQNTMSMRSELDKAFVQKETFLNEIIEKQNKEIVEETIVKKEIIIDETLETKSEEAETLEIKSEEVETLETKSEEVEVVTKEINDVKELRENSKDNLKVKLMNAENAVIAKTLNYDEIQTKFLNNESLTKIEKQYLFKNMFIDNAPYALQQNIALDLNARSYEEAKNIIQTRALDGTTQLNGLALVEILQNKRVLTEWSKIFPELTTYAQIIPLVGYNKIEQSISIADKTKATKLSEGQAAQAYNPGTTKVTLEADRYSQQITQSNQLNMFNTMMAIATKDVKNNIIEALREDFFNNLFANVGIELDTNNYQGGATKESIVYTQEVGKFTFKDLNNIAIKLIEKYGEVVLQRYFISMSSDVYNHLLEEYFGSGNVLWKGIFDESAMKFRGIQIVLSDKIPDKTIQAGKNIVAFLTKDSIIAYGCVTVIKDDPYGGISKDQMNRVIQLRGRVRMCDPNINTIVLQVRANASQVSAKNLNQNKVEQKLAKNEA